MNFSSKEGGVHCAVWRIRFILMRIRIQDGKKFVTDSDPDPGQTLLRIRIQAKMIRIRNTGGGVNINF